MPLLRCSKFTPFLAVAVLGAVSLPVRGADEQPANKPAASARSSSKSGSSASKSGSSTSSRSTKSAVESTPPIEVAPPPANATERPTAPAVVGELVPDSRKPPRGTLGLTYSRITHPVPDDKHPRLGMLAIRDMKRHPVVTVRDMGGLRLQSGIWLFESSRPLDPGASHIVRVEARSQMTDIAPYTTRFVRLIPGRIVYLDFSDPTED